MDLELARLQLADMKASHTSMLTRKALVDRQHTKQVFDLLARIAKLESDIFTEENKVPEPQQPQIEE